MTNKHTTHNTPRLTKARVTELLRCNTFNRAPDRFEMSAPAATGRLIDSWCSWYAAKGAPPKGATVEALLSGDPDVALWAATLNANDYQHLATRVDNAIDALTPRLADIITGPCRSQVAVRARLDGCTLSARLDIVTEKTWVEAKSVPLTVEHGNEAAFYALLGTLHPSRPEFVVLVGLNATETIRVHPDTPAVRETARRVARALDTDRLRSPGWWCRDCVLDDRCIDAAEYRDAAA